MVEYLVDMAPKITLPRRIRPRNRKKRLCPEPQPKEDFITPYQKGAAASLRQGKAVLGGTS